MLERTGTSSTLVDAAFDPPATRGEQHTKGSNLLEPYRKQLEQPATGQCGHFNSLPITLLMSCSGPRIKFDYIRLPLDHEH